MKNNIDEKITEIFQEEAATYKVTQNQIDHQKQIINRKIKEAAPMKRTSYKKTILALCLVAVLGTTTAFAANMIFGKSVHTNHLDEVKDYQKAIELQQENNYNVQYPENFQNGYKFNYMVPGYATDTDENGNPVSEEKIELYTDYQKTGEPTISINATKDDYENSQATLLENYKSIDIHYFTYTNMFVPGNYKLTAEEQQLVDNKQLIVSYGSNEKETREVSSVNFKINDETISIMVFDLENNQQVLTEMAKEIIDMN